MKNKKLVRLLAVVLVLVMAISLFAACKPKPAGDKFIDFINAFEGAYDLNGATSIKLDIDADLKLEKEKKNFDLIAKGTIDFTTMNKDNNEFVFKLQDSSASAVKDILNIYYQDNKMYLKSEDNVFAIRNASMLALMGLITGKTPSAAASGQALDESTSDIVKMIGDMLFDTKDIKSKKKNKVWTLNIDTVKVWNNLMNGDFGVLIKGVLDSLNLNIAGEVINTENLTKLINENPMTIKIDIDLRTKNAPTIFIEANNEKLGKINVNLNKMVVDKGSIALDASDKLDKANIDKAKVINLANVDLNGTFGLYKDVVAEDGTTVTGIKKYMTYNWSIEANIDPFAIIKAGQEYQRDPNKNAYKFWESEQLKGSKLYIQVYHKHSESECGDFCVSKRDKDITNIIDIAFDPANFGNGNIYVNINTDAVISDSALNSILNMFNITTLAAGFIKSALSENELLVIDPSVIAEPYSTNYDSALNLPAVPGADTPAAQADINIDSILAIVTEVIPFLTDGLKMNENANALIDVNASMSDLYNMLEAVGLGDVVANAGISFDQVKDIVDLLLSAGGDKLSEINITIDKLQFGNTELDNLNAYDKMFKDPVTGEDRVWASNKKPLDPFRLDEIKWNDNITDAYAPGDNFSIYEMPRIIGKKIGYQYYTVGEDELVKESKSVAQIVGWKGLDEDLFGVEQNITLVVTPIDGSGLLGNVIDLLTMSLVTSMAGMEVKLPLPCYEVPFKITLTNVKDINIVANAVPEDVYYIQTNSTEVTNITKAEATITYSNNETKTIDIEADTNLYKEGAKYYMSSVGDYYVEFSLGGRSLKYDFVMATPDEIEMHNFGTKENPIKVGLGQKTSVYTKVIYNGKADNMTLPSFNGGKLTVTYYERNAAGEIVKDGETPKIAKQYDVYTESYFFDSAIAKVVGDDEDGNKVFNKKGKANYTATWRGIKLDRAYIEVVDGYEMPYVHAEIDRNGVITLTSTAKKDYTVDYTLSLVNSALESVATDKYTLAMAGGNAIENNKLSISVKAGDWVENGDTFKYTIEDKVAIQSISGFVPSGTYYIVMTPTVKDGIAQTNMSALNKTHSGHGNINKVTFPSSKKFTKDTTFDGLFTMNYYTSDTESILLQFKFMDGKYYFVNDDKSIKIEAKLNVYDYYDATSKIELEANGTLKDDFYKSFSAKNTSCNINFDVTATVGGVECKYTKHYVSAYFTGRMNGTSKYGQSISATLAGPGVYVVDNGTVTEYKLSYDAAKGKFVFKSGTTSYDADIEVLTEGVSVANGKFVGAKVGSTVEAEWSVTIGGEKFTKSYKYSSLKA